MFCPRCHTVCRHSDLYCSCCGFPLRSADQKKGSLWLPLLFLILMSAIGIMMFFAGGNHAADADSTTAVRVFCEVGSFFQGKILTR